MARAKRTVCTSMQISDNLTYARFDWLPVPATRHVTAMPRFHAQPWRRRDVRAVRRSQHNLQKFSNIQILARFVKILLM